ncbi:TetR/AcrR family transcriptional regulator [Saccharicrinis fermentans]|uniref:HTH-type transcriptional repressor Bm3R1 n=1 Tax=Saccharicrinis fermentans DSM 9555 = JCM 21142 TaxID=869213 RepID=W7Y2V5_9BACT|nr:TetR/AcrR family transcriptional regulator [Saccharicrinis fermentans]GAF02322.1 HTH-type transcriptional repressor Bm3R1 [Saccharicrinis fermentans DSM 9555 = JCM 21142]
MMAKLQKSIDKQRALLEATLNLINNGGIQEASMAKIAKLARVSPATIYLYFENKRDLVNKLYLEVKGSFTEKAFEGYEVKNPVKKSFEQIWFNMAAFKLRHKEKASFLSQCDNIPLIDEQTRQEGLKHLQPLFDLWLRGQKEGIIKSFSPHLLYAYTIYPMAFLMNAQCRGTFQINKKVLQEAFQAAWDSIKV